MFVYAIRSPYTKESYFRRLRRFFDAINFCEGETMDNVVIHLIIGAEMTLTGPLAIYSNFYTPRRKE